MNKKIFSQEGLKILACVTMLLDHIGAVFVPSVANYSVYYALWIIGRLAFPIYCFLLAEGVAHTKNPVKYGLRLLMGVFLAEIPFDLAFSGRWDWGSQSVMVTLLLGFGMALIMNRLDRTKLVPVIIFGFLAELCQCDYGMWGIAMIALFVMTRERKDRNNLQVIGMLIVCYFMNSARVPIFGFRVPVELFAVLALIPIFLYSGKKSTDSKAIQMIFYLFYPVHLLVLYVLAKFVIS